VGAGSFTSPLPEREGAFFVPPLKVLPRLLWNGLLTESYMAALEHRICPRPDFFVWIYLLAYI
ncbi:hypothetical protein, partial [Pelobium manganitolerans]|uniref:hypothetical protein n=1 Tax=Pelobium manganitolerans TaxID=1842495 RepID=UPI003FA3C23C